MFWKPSASKVAKQLFQRIPSISGNITAMLDNEYNQLLSAVDDVATLHSVLMDIAAEAYIRGYAVRRGEGFAHKLGTAYSELSPSLRYLSEYVGEAVSSGFTQEQGMALIILGDKEPSEESLALVTQFVAGYRDKVLDIVAQAV